MYVYNPKLVGPMKKVFQAADQGDIVKALGILKDVGVADPEWELELILGFIQRMKSWKPDLPKRRKYAILI